MEIRLCSGVLVDFPNILLGIVLLIVGTIVTHFLVRLFTTLALKGSQKKLESGDAYPSKLDKLLSLLETMLYVGSVLLGQFWFIGVWLGVRTLSIYAPSSQENTPLSPQVFFIKSALQIVISVLCTLLLCTWLANL